MQRASLSSKSALDENGQMRESVRRFRRAVGLRDVTILLVVVVATVAVLVLLYKVGQPDPQKGDTSRGEPALTCIETFSCLPAL
jgi:hypothetical protein